MSYEPKQRRGPAESFVRPFVQTLHCSPLSDVRTLGRYSIDPPP